MLSFFKRKKVLTVNDFVTAIDRQVIARKGDIIDENFVRGLQALKPHGAGVYEPLGETYHSINLKMLVKAPKYAFLGKLDKKRALCLEVLDSVQVNELVGEELTWLERHRYHYDHTLAITILVTAMAIDLFDNQSKAEQAASCALTHDFGINRVPEEILLQEASLDEAESRALAEHPIYSYVLLNYYGLGGPELNAVAALEHHENLLGTGYPKGIKPSLSISILIQLADIFDALISSRPFRPAHTNAQALTIIARQTQLGQFDSDLFDLLKNCVLG